jgi:ammonium transporter, Amt family
MAAFAMAAAHRALQGEEELSCIDKLISVFGPLDEDKTKILSEVLCDPIQANYDTASGLTMGLNTAWMLTCTALVFVMHAGFAMLCAGAIRSKNTMNILLQTVLDAITTAIAFYLVGFAFAYGWGDNYNAVIGDSLFAMSGWELQGKGTHPAEPTWYWKDWVFQYAFAATATTIPAGCVAERFNFAAYLAYSVFIPAWVYPLIVHWVWSPMGWLGYVRSQHFSHLFGAGMMDFAGSGVVHMTGGFAGFWGCVLVGPRMGRFDASGKPVDMPGHSAVLVVLGTVLLWFGWYGFNPGSSLTINNATLASVAGRAAVNTTLSGAAGGLAALAIAFIRHKAWDLVAVCNGVLVGFVSVTAGCHVIQPYAAVIGGMIGACIFEGVCVLFLKFKIDDPLAASPMHGFCGIWGVLWTGLMATKNFTLEAYGGYHQTCDEYDEETGFCKTFSDGPHNYPFGLFYPGGGGRLFASQVVGVLVIIGWVTVNMVPFFLVLKFLGKLRISPEEEQAGLDVSKHGGSAYNHGGDKEAKPGLKVAPAPSEYASGNVTGSLA